MPIYTGQEINNLLSQSVALTVCVPHGVGAKRKVKALAKSYGIKGTVQRVPYSRSMTDELDFCIKENTAIKIVYEANHHQQHAMFVYGIAVTFKKYDFVGMELGERTMNQNFRVIKSVNTNFPNGSSDDDTELPTPEPIPANKVWPLVDKFVERCEILALLSDSSELENIEEKDRLVLASLKRDAKKQIRKKITQTSNPQSQSICDMEEEDLIRFVKEAHECKRLKIKEESLHKCLNFLKEEEFSGTSLMYIKEDDLKQLLMNTVNLKLGCALTLCSFVNSLKNLHTHSI